MLPLIPVRRGPDDARATPSERDVDLTVGFFLACAGGLLASALGEVSGYLLGQGDVARRRVTFELERNRYVRPSDLVYLQEPLLQPAEAARA